MPNLRVVFDGDNYSRGSIECTEYIDMIRLKEVIGESRLITDEITGSIHVLGGVLFCIFSEVLELTEEWGVLLKRSNLRHRIDDDFYRQRRKAYRQKQ